MTVTEATQTLNVQSTPDINLSIPTDRRLDVDAKQTRISELLERVGCEGLLVRQPANFAWLTSGAMARGVVDPAATPVLYFGRESRCLVCANVDTQRLFDEELDGLGFQLKEWPWYWGREQLLSDLCIGRKIACDQWGGDFHNVAKDLKQMRCKLTPYEQACYRALGQILSHALEATCRSLKQGDTEREIAGHLSHRLYHRGTYPVSLMVMVDGRSSLYRQGGFTPTQLTTYAVLVAAAQKYGLCAMASRAVCFAQPPDHFQREHDAASRVAATYIASSWPDALPRQVFTTAQRVYALTGAEHQWRQCPQGHITGRTVVESPLLPTTENLFQANNAVTWRPSIGAAISCDTFLIGEDGPISLTPTDNWPLKCIRVQGAEFFLPDILVR